MLGSQQTTKLRTDICSTYSELTLSDLRASTPVSRPPGLRQLPKRNGVIEELAYFIVGPKQPTVKPSAAADVLCKLLASAIRLRRRRALPRLITECVARCALL